MVRWSNRTTYLLQTFSCDGIGKIADGNLIDRDCACEETSACSLCKIICAQNKLKLYADPMYPGCLVRFARLRILGKFPPVTIGEHAGLETHPQHVGVRLSMGLRGYTGDIGQRDCTKLHQLPEIRCSG